MATFEGTQEEFIRFIGPHVRNKIQNKTRSHKQSLGSVCEGCKKERELQAAHVRGNDRIKIIKKVLGKSATKTKRGTTSWDLAPVIEEIMKAHTPITKAFRFLCQSCHTAYDNGRLDL